ncbi:MAG TPA: hypothetical protein VF713_17750 [Thermoanaerobaculia bacterium]
MRAQLIVDCGSRIVSALIVTADGVLLPCSQEIRQTAMRHVAAEIAFDRRVTEHADFLWDDAIEVLAKAQPHQFFQRARRIGLRRAWDADLAAGALHLASPLAVLSSAVALTDPAVEPALSAAGTALLDAMLDPVFAFAGARKLVPADLDAVVIVPAQAGRLARAALQKIFRRRGFRQLTLVSREIAAAMALVDTPATECVVWDVSDQGLHLHRVALDREGNERRLATIASTTLRALSWNEWVQRIAAALREASERQQLAAPALSMVDRALTAFLTGAPPNPSCPLHHELLQRVLGDEWRARHGTELAPRMRDALAGVGGGAPMILIGGICGIEAIRSLIIDAAGVDESVPSSDVPVLDRLVRGVAAGTLWLRGDASRRLVVRPTGGLRLNTLRGETVEILGNEQLPAAGENCHVRTRLAFRGSTDAASPFLVHLLWGADQAPEGNATLCAMRLDHARGGDGTLHVGVHLRCSRGGRRLNGTVDVRAGSAAAGTVRSRFTHELPALSVGRRSEEMT